MMPKFIFPSVTALEQSFINFTSWIMQNQPVWHHHLTVANHHFWAVFLATAPIMVPSTVSKRALDTITSCFVVLAHFIVKPTSCARALVKDGYLRGTKCVKIATTNINHLKLIRDSIPINNSIEHFELANVRFTGWFDSWVNFYNFAPL